MECNLYIYLYLLVLFVDRVGHVFTQDCPCQITLQKLALASVESLARTSVKTANNSIETEQNYRKYTVAIWLDRYDDKL